MGSLFRLYNNRNTISCSMYDSNDSFPKDQKMAKVELDNGEYKYLLLDEIINPFDSGFRYKCFEDKKTYQINTSYPYNIFNVRFFNANYYVNLINSSFALASLQKIFDSRVTDCGSNTLQIMSPRKELGITKMLIVGLNVGISYIDKVEDDVDDTFTFTTYNNGACNYLFNNINRHKMKAMLVKFEPNRLYKIKFDNTFNKWNYYEAIKNCLFFGDYVERLPETSSSYVELLYSNNFFATNPQTLEFESSKTVDSYCQKEVLALRDQYARYSGGQYSYNFYELNDITFF